MSLYCDTSFLVSLYTMDANSILAAAELERYRGALVITPLCELELTNALSLRLYRNESSEPELAKARAAFREDLASGVYSVHPVSSSVYEKAAQLSIRFTARLGSRSLDILHVAAAVVARTEAICTFDVGQRRLCEAAGMDVRPLRFPSRRRA